MPSTDQVPRITAPIQRRRGPASTEDGQRSRERVLQAAVELITEAGIDQVRVAEIARRANMSSGQLMYYFTSKEHILLETLAWRDHQDLIRTRAGLAKVTGAWRQLERFIGFYLPASPADPSWILWMEAWARAPHSAEVSQFNFFAKVVLRLEQTHDERTHAVVAEQDVADPADERCSQSIFATPSLRPEGSNA